MLLSLNPNRASCVRNISISNTHSKTPKYVVPYDFVRTGKNAQSIEETIYTQACNISSVCS